MKSLIVSSFDISGGAARAAYRVYQGLRSVGDDCKMLVQFKSSDDPHILGPRSPREKAEAFLRGKLDQIPLALYRNRTETLFSPALLGNSTVIKRIRETSPEIVNLHWVQKGMLGIGDWPKIGLPLVLTLHDMWAFTGGEHYDEEQSHFTESCGSSRVLGSTRRKDLSYKVWNRKRRVWARVPFFVVCTSRWLAAEARRSSLLGSRRIEVIPSAIDLERFRPLDQQYCREVLGVPSGKKVLVFGALDATSDPRKGADLLFKSLARLPQRELWHLLIIGASSAPVVESLGLSYACLGRLSDDFSLIAAYGAADVSIVPSRQENLSNVIIESMACGVPTVAFAIGGNSDMIDHRINGYLAEKESPEDLARGIEWVADSARRGQLSTQARTKALQTWDQKIVARMYQSLYDDAVQEFQ